MRHIEVHLSRKRVSKKDGKVYCYWTLRWTGPDGIPHTEHIGNVEGLSRRQARVLRTRRTHEINTEKMLHKTRMRLSEFLELYFQSRGCELAPGTLVLHRQTAKYLAAFFANDPRIEQLTKFDGRAFKTALAAGELRFASERPKMLAPGTVDMHLRNARAIFNHAMQDELISNNSFAHLCSSQVEDRPWHYVCAAEYRKLSDAARHNEKLNWCVLLALCRLAALRRGEALNLQWSDIDWEKNVIEVISKPLWKTKTRKSRKVPICPELQTVLLDVFDAADKNALIVRCIEVKNIYRDFGVIRRRAETEKYCKPLHSLRKSCITDWARRHPSFVVKTWAGHSDFSTTDRYYLQVPESEYNQAARYNLFDDSVQKPVQPTNHKETENKTRKHKDLTDKGLHDSGRRDSSPRRSAYLDGSIHAIEANH